MANVMCTQQASKNEVDDGLEQHATIVVIRACTHTIMTHNVIAANMSAMALVTCALLLDPPCDASHSKQGWPAMKKPSVEVSAAPDVGALLSTPTYV